MQIFLSVLLHKNISQFKLCFFFYRNWLLVVRLKYINGYYCNNSKLTYQGHCESGISMFIASKTVAYTSCQITLKLF